MVSVGGRELDIRSGFSHRMGLGRFLSPVGLSGVEQRVEERVNGNTLIKLRKCPPA